MPEKRITMKDIAQQCKVSTATVSRVLSGKGRISEKMRQLVVQTINESGYIQNASASTLRTGVSRLIGIFVTELNYEMSSATVEILQECLLEQGYDSIVCNIGKSSEKEAHYYQLMISLNVCGIVLIALRGASTLHRYGSLPIVCLYRNPIDSSDNDRTCLIETDDYGAGRIAGEELIRSGCHRIADVRLKSLDDRIPLGRHLGLLQTLYQHNLTFDDSLSIISPDSSYQELYACYTAALDSGRHADGYFCLSDAMAPALVHCLEEKGLRVPEDVKVIGCNDMVMTRYSNHRISSIRHQIPEMCRAAADAMHNMVSGSTLSPAERWQVFPVMLVRRETT